VTVVSLTDGDGLTFNLTGGSSVTAGTVQSLRNSTLNLTGGARFNTGLLHVSSNVVLNLNGDAKVTASNLVLHATTTTKVVLAPLGAGVSPEIVVTGDVSLAGGLDVLTPGFVPKYGDRYQVLSYGGTRTGGFAPARITGVSISGLKVLAPVYDFAGNSEFPAAPGTLILFVTLPGDANLDLRVNSADFGLLAVNFNRPGDWKEGDFNGDGLVNSADFGLLAANFNRDFRPLIGTSFGEVATIPEPGTLGVLALGGWLLTRRRR